MNRPTRLHAAEVLGFSRLANEGSAGVVEVVEAIHRTIARNILSATPSQMLTDRTTAAVYAAVRAFSGLAGGDRCFERFGGARKLQAGGTAPRALARGR